MKITKAIQLADILAPNKLPIELKVHYLNEVEGMAAIDVMMLATADVPVYTADNIDVEMLVKPPYDKIYVDYLVAMIHFANGEMNKYGNTFGKFNESMGEYHRYYFSRFHPADGGMIAEGYYISAYGIAVKHGFTGTEEEFADMLMNGGGGGSGGGENGITPHIGANGNWYIGTTDTGVRAAGEDGIGIKSVEQTVTSTADGGTNEITVTLTNGAKTKFYIKNGSKGSPGTSGGGGGGTGADCVGIASVEQTTTSTADGGANVITVTLTDGTVSEFYVRNGSRGSPGGKGDNYVLTDADKDEIAALAAALVDVPGGGGGGSAMTLLWENAAMHPYEGFSSQMLTIPSGYSKYLVQVVTDSSISYLFMQRYDAHIGYYDDCIDDEYVWIENYGAFIAAVHELSGTNVYIREFRLYSDDDTKIYIGSGYLKSAGSSESSNTACIPWRIYGIRESASGASVLGAAELGNTELA